jgi:hypothetical protein
MYLPNLDSKLFLTTGNSYEVSSRAVYVEKRNEYLLLVLNPEGKRPLGRPERSGWIILRWMFEIYAPGYRS